MNATHPSIAIRRDRLASLRRRRGLEADIDLANAMGMHRGNISRVLSGKQQPGPRFQAALILALDARMGDLFVVVGDIAEGTDAA